MMDSPSTYHVEKSASIAAAAATVYGIIADYRSGHPRIVPPAVFTSMEIEQGGVGVGTIIRYQMRVLGRTTTYRAAISEPEPGRVLVETDLNGRAVTTFIIQPRSSTECQATIRTELPARRGLFGWAERIVARQILNRIYAEELDRLAAVAIAQNTA